MTNMKKEEIDHCGKCGLCLAACPVYKALPLERYTPRGRVHLAKLHGWGDMALSERYREIFAKCLLCDACKMMCPAGINPGQTVATMRQTIVQERGLDQKTGRLIEAVERNHNISGEENEERGEWRDLLEDYPDHGYQKSTAEVAYFVGCVSSFFPMAQGIPKNMVQIMEHAQVDFTILSGEEWCCGFPLIGAGVPEKVKALIDHNLTKVKEIGVQKVIFSCPSCYLTWKEHYDADLELAHASQFLKDLANEGQLHFKEKRELKVTYHDPCDLGRKSGEFDAPRQVLDSLPGISLVEMGNSREHSTCCGGGGNLEMTDPELAGELAQARIEEIQQTGADIVVSSCQQCLRTLASRARRKKIDLEVMDLTELVSQALSD